MNAVKKSFARGARGLIVAVIVSLSVCSGLFSACGHEHSLEKVDAVAPTCTSEGRAEYWKCGACNEIFSDAEGLNAVTAEQLKIAPSPHKYRLGFAIKEGNYYVGEYVPEEALTYSLKCAACGDEKTPENVTVDLDKPLVQGANNFVVSCGADSTVLTVRAKPESEKVATLTVSTQKVFHAGQTVTAADFTATYAVDDRPAEAVTDFTVTNPKITAATEEIEISYKGKTAKTAITVHAVTHEEQVDSTAETEGTVEHYFCEACNKNFDAGFNEIENIKMPRMQTFAITDTKIQITNSNGAKVGLKTENGNTFLAGNPGDYYGRIFMKYNVSVDTDTDIKFYVSTCMRAGDFKIKDVYSVKINGVEIDSGENPLSCGATNNWFSKDYSLVGEGKLLAGQNNLVEVTRVNLIDKTRGGDKTYNFFGIGISALTEATITLNEPCSHVCPHCGKCTEASTTSSACLEKCLGHDGEHFCGHVCSICGGCKDATCTDAACENKCGCVEFTVMNNGVTVVDKNGATVGKNTAANEQNVSANDSSAKKGLIKITYNIHSDTEATVKLYIKTCSQTIENTVAESYSFTVGGQAVTVDAALKMPWNEANKWKDIRYTCIGEIKLAAGNNTIEIIRPDMNERELNDYTGYNFFGIALSGAATLSWAE